MIKSQELITFTGPSALSELNSMLLEERYQKATLFVLTEAYCKIHCLPILQQAVKALEKAVVIEIEAGEYAKSLDSCHIIWSKLTDAYADRNAVLLNLGGGIIGDIGGFCASTFKRGISFINIPTTLLAQVDASIGGKTAVNFQGHKNLLGTFSYPQAVVVYPGFLETLAPRELRSGLAEVLKHGLIADKNYWKQILNSNLDDLNAIAKLIPDSIRIKNEIVNEDPMEKGRRKLLNFGHTVGHAIESYSMEEDKSLLHGEAVAIGMICAGYISYRHAGLTHEELDEMCAFILSLFPGYVIDSSMYYRLIQLMKNDKKTQQNTFKFTLLTSIGVGVFDQSIDADAVIDALQFYSEKIAISYG